MADVVTVSLVEDGTKLMRWFLRKFPAMPNRDFFKLCRGGQIRVNSARVDANRILRAGDAVRIPPTIAMYAKKENVNISWLDIPSQSFIMEVYSALYTFRLKVQKLIESDGKEGNKGLDSVPDVENNGGPGLFDNVRSE